MRRSVEDGKGPEQRDKLEEEDGEEEGGVGWLGLSYLERKKSKNSA